MTIREVPIVLICHCAAVNDTCVRAAISAGSASIAEVTAACGAGGGCGGCHLLIQRLLDQTAATSISSSEPRADHATVTPRQVPTAEQPIRQSVHV